MGMLDAGFRSYSIYFVLLSLSLPLALFCIGGGGGRRGCRHSFNHMFVEHSLLKIS